MTASHGRPYSSAIVTGVMVVAAMGVGSTLLSRPARSAAPPVGFNEQVMPILQQHCVTCHSPGELGYKAIHLDLRTYQGVMAGSTYGTAVVPGHPEFSPLVAVLKKEGHSFKNLKMPPLGPLLSAEEIDVISTWIKEGAKDN